VIGPSPTTFTYSLPLFQGTLNFGKVLDSPTAGTGLCIHLDLTFLVTPSEVRSQNTLVTYPPPTPCVRLSPNSQFLRTVTGDHLLNTLRRPSTHGLLDLQHRLRSPRRYRFCRAAPRRVD